MSRHERFWRLGFDGRASARAVKKLHQKGDGTLPEQLIRRAHPPEGRTFAFTWFDWRTDRGSTSA
ncbi:unnamed protein product [Ectocarpus sp. 6 AP-2014]